MLSWIVMVVIGFLVSIIWLLICWFLCFVVGCVCRLIWLRCVLF